jgi:hypothetical protein
MLLGETAVTETSQTVGGSGGNEPFRAVPPGDAGISLVVERACLGLEKTVCPGRCPSHLLFLDHPLRDCLIHGALGWC